MSIKDNKEDTPSNVKQDGGQHSVSRRAMLKGTMTAMPAILTLHSGAALARSSNLVTTTKYKSPDAYNRTLCLDLTSVRRAGRRRNTYDMGGRNPYAHVNAINERDYYVMRRGRKRPKDEKALCERGGTAFYKEGGEWHKIKLPRGGMMSAAPMASIAAYVDITDV